MSFGGLISTGDWNSANLANQKLNHAMTGSQIAAMTAAQKKQGMQIMCTLTESGFTANHLYMMNATETAWIDLGIVEHRHSTATDGGTFYNILRWNSGFVHHIEYLSPRIALFHTAVGGTGTAIDSAGAGGIKIATGTTSASHSTAAIFGVPVTHAFPSHFKIRLQLSASTNLTMCRAGIRAEAGNEANTTLSKYGMEACSSSGSNWLLFSSSGTTRSTISTATAAATGQLDSYTFDHIITAIHGVKSSATVMGIKTSDVPTDSITSGTQVWRMGLQNTAAENKEITLAGLKILGFIELDSYSETTPLT